MKLTSEQERWVADWWQKHNIRETCQACDRDAGADHELVDHPLYMWGIWLARTCRACGHIALFNFQPILAPHLPSWPGINANTTAMLAALTELQRKREEQAAQGLEYTWPGVPPFQDVKAVPVEESPLSENKDRIS